jgi:hypothetical protein
MNHFHTVSEKKTMTIVWMVPTKKSQEHFHIIYIYIMNEMDGWMNELKCGNAMYKV